MSDLRDIIQGCLQSFCLSAFLLSVLGIVMCLCFGLDVPLDILSNSSYENFSALGLAISGRHTNWFDISAIGEYRTRPKDENRCLMSNSLLVAVQVLSLKFQAQAKNPKFPLAGEGGSVLK